MADLRERAEQIAKAAATEISNYRRKQAALSPEQIDQFLDEATHAVSNLWTDASGQSLSTDELYLLNDQLTAFFTGRNVDKSMGGVYDR